MTPVTLSDERNQPTKGKKRKANDESSEEVNTSQHEKPPGAEKENGSDGEEDLSAEEKRVLQRKLKKIRKKENKKLRKEGKPIINEELQTSAAEKAALEYLTCWSERREEWKFHKTRQIWLLKNMFDTTKVTDDHFKVLLAYIENMRGASRDITLQKAEAVVRWEGQEGEADTEDAKKKKQRAKQVVQLL